MAAPDHRRKRRLMRDLGALVIVMRAGMIATIAAGR
jgi:hypothetical protein